MRNNMKLQSAMEYLMTYGWAILIIAVVMVALFSLGLFSPSTPTACVAVSGFECTGVAFNHGTLGTWSTGGLAPGNVFLTIGQNTGTGWVAANVFFVPFGTGTSSGVPSSITQTGVTPGTGNANVILYSGGAALASGQTVNVNVPVPVVAGSSDSSLPTVGSINLGTTVQGTLWLQYWTTSGGPFYQQIQTGTMTLKAS